MKYTIIQIFEYAGENLVKDSFKIVGKASTLEGAILQKHDLPNPEDWYIIIQVW